MCRAVAVVVQGCENNPANALAKKGARPHARAPRALRRVRGTWRGNDAEDREEDARHAQPQPRLLWQSCVRTPQPATGHAQTSKVVFE